MNKRFVSAFLAAVLAAVSFSGCGSAVKNENLVDNVKPNPVPVYNRIDEGQSAAVAQFSAQILKQLCTEDKNVVYSPLSVLYALAMTANGADGETLAQMEEVFGMPLDQLNGYLHSTVNLLPSDEGYDFDIANSIWIKNDEDKFTANEDFLTTVKSYYDAGVFTAEFDQQTLKDINNWVAQKTNGQIQNVLDRIDENAVMYLINALNFEADWLNDYNEYDVNDGTFTKADGTMQDAEFMYKRENGYLSDEDTRGFIKYYKDKKYAYVALLPEEGVNIDDYIASLDGEKLTNLLNTADMAQEVETAIPKYETTYDTEMSEIFKALGMTDAFDSRLADFSKMGTAQVEGENICINRIIHKAFIRVAEKGTQAGAATVVEMVAEGAMIVENPPKEVYLNRPFVYMIIDPQTKLPLFMGAVYEIE